MAAISEASNTVNMRLIAKRSALGENLRQNVEKNLQPFVHRVKMLKPPENLFAIIGDDRRAISSGLAVII
jgi:hypothetical protein